MSERITITLDVAAINAGELAAACNRLLNSHGGGIGTAEVVIEGRRVFSALLPLEDLVYDQSCTGRIPLGLAAAFDDLNEGLGRPFSSTWEMLRARPDGRPGGYFRRRGSFTTNVRTSGTD